MARIESTYKVSFDDGTVRLCYFPHSFQVNYPSPYYELIIQPILNYGDAGYHELDSSQRGLQMLKLDQTKALMPVLLYSSSDFKTKMQPIYVVNMKYIAGRKICFREFNDYFFGISHKVTSSVGEIAIEDFEFSMNSFHDLHLQNLKYNRSLSLPDYIQSQMFVAMESDSFIDHMFALHLFYSNIAESITTSLLGTKGQQNSMEFVMKRILPRHFLNLVKASAATIVNSAMDIDPPDDISLKEANRSQIFPWTNGWRRDSYDANRLKFKVRSLMFCSF